MSIVVFEPYGLMREESGVLGLLCNHLSTGGLDTVFLHCNGVFSACGRDSELNFRREFTACFDCMSEQNRIAQWAGVKTERLSWYLTPDDVLETKRWLSEVSGKPSEISFRGINVGELCEASIRERFSVDYSTMVRSGREVEAQAILLNALRAYLALDEFFSASKPMLVMLPGGQDYLAKAALAACAKARVKAAVFSWNIAARAVHVTVEGKKDSYLCPLVFENVTKMRPDTKTWPAEIREILEELTVFLGLRNTQLELPIGAVASSAAQP